MSNPPLTLTHRGDSSLAGQTQSFPKPLVRLGRRPDNDVAFDVNRDRAVSGHHAEVYVEGGAVWIKDLGSQNGTFVDGRRISAPTQLGPGQVVRFGDAGPEFQAVLGAAAPVNPLNVATPIAADSGKRLIGAETLQMAIGSATKRERSKMYKVVGGIAGCLVLLGGTAACLLTGGLGLLWSDVSELDRKMQTELATHDEDVKKRLDTYDRELASVKGKVGSAHIELGRLMQEIEERDKKMESLVTRDELSKELKEKVKKKLESQLSDLHKKLNGKLEEMRKGAGGAKWGNLVAKYEKGIFLCVGRNQRGGIAIGTAWCVRNTGLLATNSHVVAIFDKFPIHGVVQNKTGKLFKVKRWKPHPRYNPRATNSPDVALIQIDTKGSKIPELPLASDADLKGLNVGTPLGTIGYPGEMIREYVSKAKKSSGGQILIPRAVATFKVGWIGRIMTYDKTPGAWKDTRYIQHSASTTGGTSGSPMFNSQGKVVMLNNSGLSFYLRAGPGRRVMRLPSAAEINYGIRVDELKDLMRSNPSWN